METTNSPAKPECPDCTPPIENPHPRLLDLPELCDTDSLTGDALQRLAQKPRHYPTQNSSLRTQNSPLLSSYLPPNQLTLLVSHPSTGKSLLSLHLAAALSRNEDPFQSGACALTGINHAPTQNASNPTGTPPTAPAPLPNSQTPKLSNSPEILLLLEDDLLQTVLPRLESLHADLTKLHFLPHFHSLVSTQKPTKQNPEPFRPLLFLQNYLADHPNIRFLILDPLLQFLNYRPNRLDITANLRPPTLLKKLIAIARQQNITILATATLPNLNLSNIKSSLASHPFTNEIKNILLLAEDPRPLPSLKSDILKFEISNRLLLMSLKSQQNPPPTLPLSLINGIPTFAPPLNPGVTPPGYHRLSPASSASPTLEEPCPCESPDPYATWYLQSLSLRPHDLPALTRQHRPASPAIAEAMAFLQSYLQDSGPISFKKISKDLAPNALAESTVREASRLMGIIKTPNLYQRNWVWHLKDDLRPFPGDPKTNPALQQAKDRAKEQAFFAHQEKRRLQFAASLQPTPANPPKPSGVPPLGGQSPQNKSTAQTPQVQQNQPSQPTPTAKPVPQPPQPPRPPIPLGPITS